MRPAPTTTEEAEDRYIEALDAFEAGDYDCARVLLVPLRLRTEGDEVRDEADALLRRMDPDPRQAAWVWVALAVMVVVVTWTIG